MAATSVTGVGNVSARHYTLGVSHLIGPRFTKKHEHLLTGLVISQTVTLLIVVGLVINALR